MNPSDILQFWFDGLTDQSAIKKNNPPASRWFAGGRAFDAEIRRKFESDLIKAKAGEYKTCESSAQGRLALVILFDQFSRNIYRNQPEAFAADPLALDLTQRSIGDGMDRKLSLIERVFLYMPLMHAESLALQDQSVAVFTAIVEESKTVSPQNTPYFEYNLSYARGHRDVIMRFGRFPHRNSALKRTSTPEEAAFLRTG